jgi:nitrogen fixation protein FixH
MSPILRKDRIWPTIIVGVLVIDVAVGFAMMRVAADDPHAAIEPDYYQKAVIWDSTLAQSHRNAVLGWTLESVLGAITPGHEAPLTLRLHDGRGDAVVGATLQVEAMQVAHAGDIVHATLTARGDSDYVAALPMTRPGLWELRIVATRGSDRFTADLRLDASTTAMARPVRIRPGDAPGAQAATVPRPAGS